MSDRDGRKQDKIPVEARRRVLMLLSSVVTAPVVTVLFPGRPEARTPTY
jgi:hypothetical protein